MITESPADFVSVADLRTYLRKSSTAEDGELGRFVSSACQMIVERVGQVSPVTAYTDARVADGLVVLEHRPVISVTSVVRLPGGEAVMAADPLSDGEGWALSSPEGVVRVRGPHRVRIFYVAGRDPVPANYSLAALELAGHLWRSSQLNQSGGRPMIGDGDQMVMPGAGYALPYRVRELLGLGRLPHDEPLVG